MEKYSWQEAAGSRQNLEVGGLFVSCPWSVVYCE